MVRKIKMFEVQLYDGEIDAYEYIFKTPILAKAQGFYHEYRGYKPDDDIRLVEVLRKS
jgi:hypothetical protein